MVTFAPMLPLDTFQGFTLAFGFGLLVTVRVFDPWCLDADFARELTVDLPMRGLLKCKKAPISEMLSGPCCVCLCCRELEKRL